MTVAKLRGARYKKRRKFGKCEGRKTIGEGDPRIVAAARGLAEANNRISLRQISATLAGAMPDFG